MNIMIFVELYLAADSEIKSQIAKTLEGSRPTSEPQE